MIGTIGAQTAEFTWDLIPLAQLLPAWGADQDRLTYSVTQRIDWVSLWQQHVNQDCFCVVARSHSGQLEMVLTLEVVKQGPLTIAVFPGGTHANENFACFSKALANLDAQSCLAAVKSQIELKRPDIDVVYLHRQVQTLSGMKNPLLPIKQSSPTDIALSFTIDGDFQTLVEGRDWSKRLKKNRKAGRRFEARGGWTYSIINDPHEAEICLARFFVLKGQRFALKGIPNVFASKDVQNFFDALFKHSILDQTNTSEIHVLKVAGEIVAISGNMILGNRVNVDFNAVNDDTDPNVSHGEFLYCQMIENACQRGFKMFSLGIGDERYKRSWCNIETSQYNTTIPITWKGSLAAQFEGVKTKTKRAIKANKRVYAFLKTLRKSRQNSAES